MPGSLMMVHANEQLQAPNIPTLLEEHRAALERLGEPGSLVSVAKDVLSLSSEDEAYLNAIPEVIQESIRAAVYQGLSLGKSIHFAYGGAYDFGVAVNDYGEGVSVTLSGPYTTSRPGGLRPPLKLSGVQIGTTSRARKPARRKASVRKTGGKRPQRRGR